MMYILKKIVVGMICKMSFCFLRFFCGFFGVWSIGESPCVESTVV